MGSPGTFGLSKKKADKILRIMAPPTETEESVTGVPSTTRGQRFFKGILSDPKWKDLLAGSEWRSAARILSRLAAAARVNAQQKKLGEWATDQGFLGETALIKLGNKLLERLDEDLAERDLIAFELANYALRQTVDKLYAPPGTSPFDVDQEKLCKGLASINVDTALKTYIEAYLQEVVRHLVGGLSEDQERERSEFLSSIEAEEEMPQLAGEFLNTLREYSRRKYGKGRPISELLNDIPEWLADASKELFRGGSE